MQQPLSQYILRKKGLIFVILLSFLLIVFGQHLADRYIPRFRNEVVGMSAHETNQLTNRSEQEAMVDTAIGEPPVAAHGETKQSQNISTFQSDTTNSVSLDIEHTVDEKGASGMVNVNGEVTEIGPGENLNQHIELNDGTDVRIRVDHDGSAENETNFRISVDGEVTAEGGTN